MNKSESIKNLAEALSKAQTEMPTVKFNAKNPFLKNRYADLGAIISTSKPILAKHGLSVSQLTGNNGDCVGVETVLMHESGEWLESSMYLPVGVEKGKSQAQVAGSIITYLRRYSLSAILGMYSDEDGDGNQPAPQQQAKPAPKKQSVIVANDRFNKIELLRTQIQEKAQALGVYNATDNQRQLLRHLLDDVIYQDKGDKRHQLLFWLFGNQSLKAEGGISGAEIKIMLDWLKPVKDSGGAYAVKTGQTKACFEIARQEEIDKGQIELEL